MAALVGELKDLFRLFPSMGDPSKLQNNHFWDVGLFENSVYSQ